MTHAGADNRYTRGLAEFVSGLSYERIPQEVRARIKLLMLDSLGCALFGAGLEWTRILRRTLAAADTSRGAILWGTNERLSAPHAALVNGTAVQGFELDDVHRQGVLHVGAVTLPALFAAVEMMSVRGANTFSGRDLIRSAVAGYEVGPRARHRRHPVGRADGRAIRRHGQAHARGSLIAERALRRAARL
jgi:aconitate decarboxylase